MTTHVPSRKCIKFFRKPRPPQFSPGSQSHPTPVKKILDPPPQRRVDADRRLRQRSALDDRWTASARQCGAQRQRRTADNRDGLRASSEASCHWGPSSPREYCDCG